MLPTEGAPGVGRSGDEDFDAYRVEIVLATGLHHETVQRERL